MSAVHKGLLRKGTWTPTGHPTPASISLKKFFRGTLTPQDSWENGAWIGVALLVPSALGCVELRGEDLGGEKDLGLNPAACGF